MRLCLALALGAVSAVSASAASDDPPPPIIDSIEIVVEDVFEDEGRTPDYWPYRLANRLHIETREKVIRQELLFAEGERIDEESIAQTERNLRALPFLRDASIETIPTEDGRRHVRVVASDAWSTRPELRLAKVGNEWVWGVGGSEENLFGRGKQLEVLYNSSLDRDETFVFYRDPRLVGSRVSLGTLFSNASDGHRARIGATRPFFAVDTLWSFRTQFDDFERLDPIYENGERIEDLPHTGRLGEMEVARAVRRRPTSAVRLHWGYRFSDDDVAGDRRRFGMLRFGVTSVEHRFLKLTHVNRFERPEDINLGNEAAAFLGISTPALGGEEGTSYFFFLSERRGLPLGPNGFLLGNVSWQTRHRGGGLENNFARFRLDFVQKVHPRRTILAKAEVRYGRNLDPEIQIRLGAESGLRGYPVRQFNGNRSLLLSTEARWFLVDDLLHVVSVGAAAFFDSGFAWPEGTPMALHDLRSNFGVSLLVGRNRVAGSRPAVRFDLAYALQPVAGRSRWLFSAGSSVRF